MPNVDRSAAARPMLRPRPWNALPGEHSLQVPHELLTVRIAPVAMEHEPKPRHGPSLAHRPNGSTNAGP